MKKNQWREKMKIVMENVEDQKNQGEQALQQIVNWGFYQRAKKVACFSSMEKEIDTLPLLKNILCEGKELFLPKTFGKGKMKFFKIENLDRRIEGPFHILEPFGDEKEIEPSEIDLIFVPAMAVDRRGNRLGYGGGYYDRYLLKVKGVSAALVLSQQVQDTLPCENTDFLVKYIIESRTITQVSE